MALRTLDAVRVTAGEYAGETGFIRSAPNTPAGHHFVENTSTDWHAFVPATDLARINNEDLDGAEDLLCRTCSKPYDQFGDGYNGECPDCADRTAAAEEEAEASGGVRAMYTRLAGEHDAEPVVPDQGGGVKGDRFPL